MENHTKKVLGIIFTVLGSFGILTGLFIGIIFFCVKLITDSVVVTVEEFTEELGSDAVEASGEIIEVVTEAEHAYTMIGFYDIEDAYYEVEIPAASSLYEAGDQVTVYYEKDNPDNSIVPEIAESVLGLIGTIFSTVGIAVLVIAEFFGVVFLVAGIVLIKKSKITN